MAGKSHPLGAPRGHVRGRRQSPRSPLLQQRSSGRLPGIPRRFAPGGGRTVRAPDRALFSRIVLQGPLREQLLNARLVAAVAWIWARECPRCPERHRRRRHLVGQSRRSALPLSRPEHAGARRTHGALEVPIRDTRVCGSIMIAIPDAVLSQSVSSPGPLHLADGRWLLTPPVWLEVGGDSLCHREDLSPTGQQGRGRSLRRARDYGRPKSDEPDWADSRRSRRPQSTERPPLCLTRGGYRAAPAVAPSVQRVKHDGLDGGLIARSTAAMPSGEGHREQRTG